MSDTPETDAEQKLLEQHDLETCPHYRYVRADFARKLERERDEAVSALDALLHVVGLTPIAGNKAALQEAFDQGILVVRKLKG